MFYIQSNDCTKLAVYDYNPHGSRTIILVHGWPLSHKMFEYQIPTLLQYDYRIVMNQPVDMIIINWQQIYFLLFIK